MPKIFLFLALSLAVFLAAAGEPAPAERRALLDAVRPSAAALAGQSVRIKVDSLQVDRGWAVLVGSLVSARGGEPDWRLAKDCHPELDKMLWVVARQVDRRWRVKHIEICASEPPYWYMEQYGGLVWPCGVYAGLIGAEGGPTLEELCRRQRPRKP